MSADWGCVTDGRITPDLAERGEVEWSWGTGPKERRKRIDQMLQGVGNGSAVNNTPAAARSGRVRADKRKNGQGPSINEHRESAMRFVVPRAPLAFVGQSHCGAYSVAYVRPVTSSLV